MSYRVTKAVTKHHRTYAVGEIIDNPTSVERSLARLFKWEHVDVAPQTDEAADLDGLRKPELVQLANDRGLDSSGLTKADLIELLTD